MKYVDIKPYLNEFIKNWNDELGLHYQMYNELLYQNIIKSDHIVPEGTKAIINNNTFVGLIVSKIYNGNVPIETYNNTGFISMIFVKKEERNKGYGKLLIQLAKEELKKIGVNKIFLGMDINNFFPGLPNQCANGETQKFLEKVGFKSIGKAYNLILSKNPNFQFDNSFNQRVANIEDKESLLEFIKREFSSRWYYEALDYFNKGGTGREFALLLDQNKIIGFARINDKNSIQIMHNINWSKKYDSLGGIGPLGVDKNYRGRNLGLRVTQYGTQKLFERGCSDVIVDWTGITKFYEKLGFKICDEFFAYMMEI